MKRHIVPTFLLLVLGSDLGCGEGREDRLKRQLGYQEGDEKSAAKDLPPEIPPHPTRDKLAPVLKEVYSQPKLPDVTEADIEVNDFGYELTPGVMSVVRLAPGLSPDKQVRAIVLGTAEADGFAYRPESRRPYAEQLQKVRVGYGDDQKNQILKRYADLKLLNFFNGDKADAAIAQLPADVKAPVEAMKSEYLANKKKIWDEWMAVKMYARRVVAGDEPFRGVLRDLKKEMGMEEPPPRTWADSMDGPFKAWAQEIAGNDELVAKLTNLRELRQREEFMNDTHSLWAIEGSPIIPAKAKNLPPDKNSGFATLREDLGGGYNDLTYVFSRKLAGDKLKYAFLQSIIFGSLLSDFQLLATAGGDFADREDGRIDPKTAVVPDKYDPLYARCGAEAALDTFIVHYKSKYPILQGLSPKTSNPDRVLDRAHECVIEGARPEIWIPNAKDDTDVEGPAPGTRLGLYQMLARYESVDVNMARMAAEERTAEDDVIDDAEAVLKRLKQQEEAGKGIK